MTKQTAIYHLSCHCQTHVLQLTLPREGLFSDFSACDCSHCLKRRIISGEAPKGSLKIIRGVGTNGVELQEYRTGTKTFGHQFCGRCGTYLLGDKFRPDADGYMYNARAIRDDHFDLWKHKLTKESGPGNAPRYTHPKLDDLPGAAKYVDKLDGGKQSRLYVGSCHCQAVKFAVKSVEPLETAELNDCACSMCLGNGVIWLYPPQRNVFFSPSKSSEIPSVPASGLLNDYRFGKGENAHLICKTCGCHVLESRLPDKPDDGSFGINITLLSNIGDYLNDVIGIDADGKQLPVGKSGAVLKGLERTIEDKTTEPLYKLNL